MYIILSILTCAVLLIIILFLIGRSSRKAGEQGHVDSNIGNFEKDFLDSMRNRDPLTNFIPKEAELALHNITLENNPNDIQSLYLRGLAYHDMGSFQHAIVDFERVIVLTEEDAKFLDKRVRSFFFIGKICLTQKHYHEAKLYLQQVMDLSKNHNSLNTLREQANRLLVDITSQ